MSAVFVLAPTIIASWPAITAAVAGAAAVLGLSVAREGVQGVRQAVAAGEEQEATVRTVEVTVENAEVVGQVMAAGQDVVLAKGDLKLRVFRDERGQCKVCVEGPGRSDEELRLEAEQFVNKVTQMYVYNRVMTELKNKGFTVISEEMAQDESVHVHVRQHAV